jgi:acyl-CoA reductase-like NAD-dependent aldehyde dehydrogenase
MHDDRTAVLETSLLIGDRHIDDSKGGWLEHVNPATGQPNPRLSMASVEEVDDAVVAAHEGFEVWKRWTPDKRRDALFRLADLMVDQGAELGVIGSLETGAPYSPYGWAYSADWLRYYAGWADKITGESINAYPFPGIDYTKPEPVGVVAVFTASNGPSGFLGMAASPALAAGCAIVIKPPELAPYSGITFGRLALEAGLPPGVVNVVNGGGDVGEALVTNRGVNKVTFTGGTATGRRLQAACAENLTPLVLELGGKSANIIFADADVDAAIVPSARFTMNAGQGCSMPTRLLVERPVYDRVIDGVHQEVSKVVIGRPFDEGVTMGPVISERSANRIVNLVTEAKESGAARVLCGGGRVGGDFADGFFVEPTILVDVDNSAPIAQTEIFGPVVCVIPFDTEEEAIALANDTDYGLAAYAQTRDMNRAHRLIDGLDAGTVHINSTGPGPVSPASPFGGVKRSGYGREGSRLGLDEFLMIKNVYLNI